MTTAPDRASEDLPTLRGSVPPLDEWARTFVVGLFMGTADAVPGVSGGTIALIAGVYERLIAAITAITPARVRAFLRALTPLNGGFSLGRALARFEEFDGWFLLALVAGIASAVVTVTRAVHVADERAPVLLFGFFFGLIAASAVILLRAITIRTRFAAGAAVAGFAIAFVVSGLGETLEGGGLAVVFVAGAIGVSAMILPGISGSLLLVVLSQYTRMSEALSEFLDALVGLATGGATADVVGPGREVGTFVVGGLVGLFTISRVIRAALAANREATLAFLVALVVGALRAPVAEIGSRDGIGWSTATISEFAAVALVGAVVVLVIDWYAVDIDLEAA